MRCAQSCLSILVALSAAWIAGCSSVVEVGDDTMAVDTTPPDQPPPYALFRAQSRDWWYELDQNWNSDMRWAYWFTPQGSRMMPYDWFINLDRAAPAAVPGCDSDRRFACPANLARFGFIPAPRHEIWNPDGLPIGFARTKPLPVGDGVSWVGPTCSACHTNQIFLEGLPYPIVVDGAPALADFITFNLEMLDALSAAWTDDTRFAAFADRVLVAETADGAPPSDAARQALRDRMAEHEQWLNNYVLDILTGAVDDTAGTGIDAYRDLARTYAASIASGTVPPVEKFHGNGRVDALGAILNQTAARNIGEVDPTVVTAADGSQKEVPGNLVPSAAPVSFPFLWGTPQSAVVQWNGLAANETFGIGGLGRNVGEVLGVYGRVGGPLPGTGEDSNWSRIKENRAWIGLENAVNLNNIGMLEGWISQLRAPAWPDALGGAAVALDPQLVARGRDLYHGLDAAAATRCVACHAVMPRSEQDQSYDPVMIPVDDIGTDPLTAVNYLLARNPNGGGPWRSGDLVSSWFFGDMFAERGDTLIYQTLMVMLNDPVRALEAAVTGDAYDGDGVTFDATTPHYKARPLTGIWATAPFLHNGSVPTLYDLLLPSPDGSAVLSPEAARRRGVRPTRFRVGNPVFDPVNVGFSTGTHPRHETYLFDTRIPGNGNRGHEGDRFGTTLNEADRRALLEYLKTL